MNRKERALQQIEELKREIEALEVKETDKVLYYCGLEQGWKEVQQDYQETIKMFGYGFRDGDVLEVIWGDDWAHYEFRIHNKYLFCIGRENE